jgi:hypothetical protein
MTIAPKAWAALTGSVVATMALLETVPRPDQFWPDSWVGFASATTVILTFVTLVVTRALGLHRWGQKGLYDLITTKDQHVCDRLDRMDETAKATATELRKQMVAMKEHYDTELLELQEHYDTEIKDMRHDMDEKLNMFTGAVKERLDGFGIRQERHELLAARLEGEQRASVEDRRHINQQLERLSAQADRILERLTQSGMR